MWCLTLPVATYAQGKGNAKDVPALIEALQSADVEKRGNAAFALGKLGAAAKAAVPGLLGLLKDPEHAVHVRPAFLGHFPDQAWCWVQSYSAGSCQFAHLCRPAFENERRR